MTTQISVVFALLSLYYTP